jgi:hypothetical protein
MLITLECSATPRRLDGVPKTPEKRGNTSWFPVSPRRIQSLVMISPNITITRNPAPTWLQLPPAPSRPGRW